MQWIAITAALVIILKSINICCTASNNPFIAESAEIKAIQTAVETDYIPGISRLNPQDSPHHDLQRQFYEIITAVPCDPCFVAKLYGIKLIDIFSDRNSLQNITITDIKGLSSFNDTAHFVDECSDHLVYDTIYDPKYYVTPSAYWMAIMRFHADWFCDASAFRLALNQNFYPFKLQLIADPALVQEVVFPLMMAYKSRNGNYLGFPDLGVSEQRPTADRGSQFFHFLTRCAVDRGFVGRLAGLKVIDEHQPECDRTLQSISFEAIKSLRVSPDQDLYRWDEFMLDVAATIHFPEHYGSAQMFVDTLNRVHQKMTDDEFKITAEHWISHQTHCRVAQILNRQTLAEMNHVVLRRYRNLKIMASTKKKGAVDGVVLVNSGCPIKRETAAKPLNWVHWNGDTRMVRPESTTRYVQHEKEFKIPLAP